MPKYIDCLKEIERIERLESDIYNASDYGALGDGITDDYAILQSVVKKIEKVGGGKLYLPAGEYRVSNVIKINSSNVEICGESRDLTTIYSSGTGPAMQCLMVINTANANYMLEPANRLSNIYVHDIGFDMSLAYVNPTNYNNDDPAKGSLMIYGCDNVIVENVKIYKTVNEGLDVCGCYNVKINKVDVEYLKGVNRSSGILWGGNAISVCNSGWIATSTSQPAKIGNYTVTNCHVYGSEQWPAPLTNGATSGCNIGIMCQVGDSDGKWQIEPVVISNCIVERCIMGIISEGMKIGGTGGCIISNNVIKNCLNGAQLLPDDGSADSGHNSREFMFVNNRVHDILGTGLVVEGENVVIANNIICDWGKALTADSVYVPSNMTLEAHGIKIAPAHTNSKLGVFRNVKVNENILYLTSTRVLTGFLAQLHGIYIVNGVVGRTFRDIQINGNIIDGCKSTAGDWPSGYHAIRVYGGEIQTLDIANNHVTGFPSGGVMVQLSNEATPTVAPRRINIFGNTFYDFGFGSASGNNIYAIIIKTAGTHYRIFENTVYQIEGSNLAGVLSVPQISSADSALDYLEIKNNTSYNLKSGGTVYDLHMTGTNIINTDNVQW
jgi:hypothetical protein